MHVSTVVLHRLCTLLQITLSGDVPRSGLLMVDCKLGWMVSDSRPVVVTCDPALEAEVGRVICQTSSDTAGGGGGGEQVWCHCGDVLIPATKGAVLGLFIARLIEYWSPRTLGCRPKWVESIAVQLKLCTTGSK